MSQPLRVVQISDMHLFADPMQSLLQVNTKASFTAVIHLLEAAKNEIDLILLTGDLSQDCSKTSYQLISELLEPLQKPIYYIPGNHDDPAVMAEVYQHGVFATERHIVHSPWQIILLNSQKPGQVVGELNAGQLDYLQQCLQKNATDYALIVFHHQPIPIGSAWLDKSKLENAEAFWQVVANYPQVKAVIYGHVHQASRQIKNGVVCYSTPSTCIQFQPQQEKFKLDPLPPGYRWLHLYDDGRIDTDVKRVANYVGTFDSNAKGY